MLLLGEITIGGGGLNDFRLALWKSPSICVNKYCHCFDFRNVTSNVNMVSLSLLAVVASVVAAGMERIAEVRKRNYHSEQ